MATWGATRAAPLAVKLTHVNVVMPKPVAAVTADGETKLARAEGVRLEVTPETSIEGLREQLIAHFRISPRKSVTIRWWGAELVDGHDLSHYRISDGSQLEVVLRSRTMTELEALAKERPLSRVRVQTFSGRCVTVENVLPTTTPRAIKQALVDAKLIDGFSKGNLATAVLYFAPMAPLFAPGTLPTLDDDKPIGEIGVMDGDILTIKFAPIVKDEKKKR